MPEPGSELPELTLTPVVVDSGDGPLVVLDGAGTYVDGAPVEVTALGIPLSGYRTTPPLTVNGVVCVTFTTTLPGFGEHEAHVVVSGDGRISPVFRPSGVRVGFDADYRDLIEAIHGDSLLSHQLHAGLVETTGDIAALSFAEGIISGRPFRPRPSTPVLLDALRRFAADPAS
ncbi:MAG: hypothetical protein ACOYOQ_15795 [Microthrixaceae bacterium]